MVYCHEIGTFGNRMWQYAVARLLAEKHGLKFEGLEHHSGFYFPTVFALNHFPNTEIPVNGDVLDEPVTHLEGHDFDFDSVPRGRINMRGFFQRYEYVKDHKEKIKEWFKTEDDVKPPMDLGPNDLVLSIRRGWKGYDINNCPKESFFLDLLKRIDYERIILCTEAFDDPFFKFLGSSDRFHKATADLSRELDCEVIKADFPALEQFLLIKSANKIVITPSTFCWWAAWLSDATEIYYPWIGDNVPAKGSCNYWVDDEERYIIEKIKKEGK